MAVLTNQKWVSELYRAILGRARPDDAGYAYWTHAIDAGIHTQWSVYQEFVRSAEGQRALRARWNDAYQNILGRPADSEGLEHWMDQVLKGKVGPELPHMEEVLRNSDEFANLPATPAAGGSDSGPGASNGGVGDTPDSTTTGSTPMAPSAGTAGRG